MTLRPRFLIDENLTPKLVNCARDRFYVAMHLRDMGLLTEKDWDLLKKIHDEDWTLVTNNVDEFRRRYRTKNVLHAGIVFLLGVDAGRNAQIASFLAALDDIDIDGDLLNTEILVRAGGDGTFNVSRFDLP